MLGVRTSTYLLGGHNSPHDTLFSSEFPKNLFLFLRILFKMLPDDPSELVARATHFGKCYLGRTRWGSQPRDEVTTGETAQGWKGIWSPPWGPGLDAGQGGPQDGEAEVGLSRTTPQKAFWPALGRTGLWDKPSWGLRLLAWLRHHSERGVQGNLGPVVHLHFRTRQSKGATEGQHPVCPHCCHTWALPPQAPSAKMWVAFSHLLS